MSVSTCKRDERRASEGSGTTSELVKLNIKKDRQQSVEKLHQIYISIKERSEICTQPVNILTLEPNRREQEG